MNISHYACFNDLSASDLMTSPVLKVQATWTIPILAHFLSKHRLSGAPVVDHTNHIVGVITLTDLMSYFELSNSANINLLASDEKPTCLIDEIMTTNIITAHANCPVQTIMAKMTQHNIHRVFITETNQLIGVVSTSPFKVSI